MSETETHREHETSAGGNGGRPRQKQADEHAEAAREKIQEKREKQSGAAGWVALPSRDDHRERLPAAHGRGRRETGAVEIDVPLREPAKHLVESDSTLERTTPPVAPRRNIAESSRSPGGIFASRDPGAVCRAK